MEADDDKEKLYEPILVSRGKEIETLHSISTLLHTGLNRKMLAVLLELIESGVDPESLVDGKFCRMTCVSYGSIF